MELRETFPGFIGFLNRQALAALCVAHIFLVRPYEK